MELFWLLVLAIVPVWGLKQIIKLLSSDEG